MRIASVLRWTLLAAIVAASASALAYDGSPPPARTAAPVIAAMPAEGVCASCHAGAALNTGGSVELRGLPASYVPGATYTLTLHLSSSQTAASSSRRWGFQVTGIKMLDGSGAGSFADVSGQGTKVASGGGSFASRRYVEVDTGNQAGAVSPVEWQMTWTAPSAGAGPLSFYFVGLAGNGGSGNNGDFVYTGWATVPEASTPVWTTTWGAVKACYDR